MHIVKRVIIIHHLTLILLNIELDCAFTDNFKPLAVVIRDEMTDEQREQLCQHVIEAFREFRSEDLVSLTMLLPMLMDPSHGFQTIALKKIFTFLTNEMRMQIID